MADLAIATFNDMHENANMIAGLDRTIPLVADADTGFVFYSFLILLNSPLTVIS